MPAEPTAHPQEIELKLALPTADPAGLQKRLARLPLLARRKATRRQLHNIYHDTPAHQLHAQRVALRLRRVGSAEAPEWLQTLKMGGDGASALSRRGEWEVPVPGPALDPAALQATPWAALDADGHLLAALVPCFVTQFERCSWQVKKADGSLVEVALDIGQVSAGPRQAPICELELELLAGRPEALFEVAREIAAAVPVLPLGASKAERGYALLDDALAQPVRARPPRLDAAMALPEAAQCVLREMFGQFTANLNRLRLADDPELVHQARVGWRRFRSAWRLFRPALAASAPPPAWTALAPLLTFVGELRDLDVARHETLPALAEAYAAGDAPRRARWQAMLASLTEAAQLQRKSVRYALEVPAVGAALLALTEWLEHLPALAARAAGAPPEAHAAPPLRPWARERTRRLHRQLKRALKAAADADGAHQARIAAKRLRYAVEALRPLLPGRQAKRWHAKATGLQTQIGAARDLGQAAVLVAGAHADAGLAEFLRGFAAAQAGRR